MFNQKRELFDKWNLIKQNLDRLKFNQYFPKEGEVWICTLGKNIGSEQDGGVGNFTRPVIIIKKINNQIFWVIPISSKNKNISFYNKFIDNKNRLVSAIIIQIRSVSIKRFRRRLYSIPDHYLYYLKTKIKNTI